ncbi:MAG TPA: hypothetical protein V6C95_16650 [Coleofasciculaceae cyanobacterium]
MEDSSLHDQFIDARTDEDELEEVLDQFDLDESLERRFNAIDERFTALQIKYQSLLNTRRFLNGTQS